MNVIPVAALTIGALLLALGLTSSSRKARRDGRDASSDVAGWSGDTSSVDCGGDGGGGCD